MKKPKKKFDNNDSLKGPKTNLEDPIAKKRLNDDDDDDFDSPLDDDLGGFDDLDSLVDDDDDF